MEQEESMEKREVNVREKMLYITISALINLIATLDDNQSLNEPNRTTSGE